MRRAALVLLSLLGACGPVATSGDFDGVRFAPDRLVLAVADRHDIVESGGSLLAVQRAEERQTLTLALSGAPADPLEEWRRLPADQRLFLKKELATKDGVLLRGIPFSAAKPGENLEVKLSEDGRTGTGAFEAFLVVGLPLAEQVASQSLGADVNVKVLFDDVSIGPSGYVSGRIEVKRARADGQEGEVATGEVTISFSAPLVPERLGKANLALLAPVMACAAAVGPSRAGICRDEPQEPVVDAGETLRGELP